MFKIYSILRIFFIILQNLFHIPAYLITTHFVLYPVYLCNSKLYWKLENYLYNFTLHTVSSWSWCAGIKVFECGSQWNNLNLDKEDLSDDDNEFEELIENFEEKILQSKLNEKSKHNNLIKKSKQKKILFIPNHQSTSDVPLMFAMFSEYWDNTLLWIMDKQFKYTNFGLVSWTHGDYFIQPGKFVSNELTTHCLKYKEKNTYILFPEGGFRYKKKESSDRYAEKMNLPKLKYVTWPRFGAFNDLMNKQLNIKYIIDCTILYPDFEKSLSILDILKGNRKADVYLHYRLFNLRNEDINENWLRKVWLHKDELMQQFYENKDLFLKNNPVYKETNLKWLNIILINIFYLLLSALYCMFFLFLFYLI